MPAITGELRRCEYCGTETAFLRHERTGKLAPIETAAHPDGRFLVDWDQKSYRTIAGISKDGKPFNDRVPGGKYYRNHYEVCETAQFTKEHGR